MTALRIGVGAIMVAHGWQKLLEPSAWEAKVAGFGVAYPEVFPWLAIAGEFAGGLGLVLGFLTPLAAAGVAATMFAAIWLVHWGQGLFANQGGFEYPLVMALVALYFMMKGAGPISVDAWLRRRRSAKRAHSGRGSAKSSDGRQAYGQDYAGIGAR